MATHTLSMLYFYFNKMVCHIILYFIVDVLYIYTAVSVVFIDCCRMHALNYILYACMYIMI